MEDQGKDSAERFGEAMCEAVLHISETDRFKKAKQAFLDALWDDLQYSVIDQMPEVLEGLVRSMADNAVEAMLKGQPDQVERYLKLNGWTGRNQNHPVIHGKLHRNHAIALRAQVAEANEALLRDEAIKDLQDQVASLVDQVNAKDAEITRLRDARSHWKGGDA